MSLSSEEKQQLAKRISKGIQVVCSSIAQLHLSSPDPSASLKSDPTGIIQSLRKHGEKKWKFTNIEGALLLTRDKFGYCHFRIYDLDLYKLRFQYELYENMKYERLSDRCHAFEMESCVCGFSFSDNRVAEKFFERVQNNIIRTNTKAAPVKDLLFSPGFSAPTVHVKRSDGRNLSVSGSSKSNGSGPNEGNLFLQNGLLDPDNVPSEWKKILRKAGIRKRDLRNPKMQDLIKDTLAQYNISLDPPPLDMDDAEIRQHYSAEQLAAYEQYKRDLEAYQRDMERYEREMEEFEKQQAKQKKLDEMISKAEQKMSNGYGNQNLTGADRLRQSVLQFQGKELASVLPAALPALQAEEAMKPRMSVARPLVPALPPIPQKDASQRNPSAAASKQKDRAKKKQASAAKMIQGRSSKMVFAAPSFLADIKKNDFQLKHVSVLPDLNTVAKGSKDGILNTLMERVRQQREALGEDDDDDYDDGDDDDFSEISD